MHTINLNWSCNWVFHCKLSKRKSLLHPKNLECWNLTHAKTEIWNTLELKTAKKSETKTRKMLIALSLFSHLPTLNCQNNCYSKWYNNASVTRQATALITLFFQYFSPNSGTNLLMVIDRNSQPNIHCKELGKHEKQQIFEKVWWLCDE